MKKPFVYLLALIAFTFIGCGEDCTAVDCIYDAFVFKLVNPQGENLLNGHIVNLEQISLYNSENPTDSLQVSLYGSGDESQVISFPSHSTDAYTLRVKGYGTHNLTLSSEYSSGKCCSSYIIHEAFLDGQQLQLGEDNSYTIVLP